jgi:hypothetical protein
MRVLGYIFNWVYTLNPRNYYRALTWSYLAIGSACMLVAWSDATLTITVAICVWSFCLTVCETYSFAY